MNTTTNDNHSSCNFVHLYQSMKHKYSTTSRWTLVFRLFALIQLVAIFVFNFTHLQYEAGFDSSAAMAQAMEIWKQKTIFLTNWDYQSTLGLDSVIVLSSLLYGLTHNIFLAYGIADCIGVLFFLSIFYDLFKMLGLNPLSRAMTYVVLLTPYSLEPLGYMPMLFTGAAYYLMKALLPVMLIDILLHLHRNDSVKRLIPLGLLFLVLTWLTAFSCGVYLFICGILPILLYEIWLILVGGQLRAAKNSRIAFLSCTLITYIIGLISASVYGATEFANQMILCKVSNITDNFIKWFNGFFELFGALPSKDIVVTSVYGIHYLSHMAAALIFIACLILTLKKHAVILRDDSDHLKQHALALSAAILVVNTAVLLLTDTTYGSDTYEFRYHLIPLISGMIIFAIGLHAFTTYLRTQSNHLIRHTFLACFACIWVMCNVVFLYYFQSENNYDTCEKILTIVEDSTDASMLYFIGEDDDVIETARITRLIDDQMTVADGYALGYFNGWGTSTLSHDLNSYSDPIAVICKNDTYESFSEEEKEAMTLVQTVDVYRIYLWNK